LVTLPFWTSNSAPSPQPASSRWPVESAHSGPQNRAGSRAEGEISFLVLPSAEKTAIAKVSDPRPTVARTAEPFDVIRG
jgi:hypothetical protein